MPTQVYSGGDVQIYHGHVLWSRATWSAYRAYVPAVWAALAVAFPLLLSSTVAGTLWYSNRLISLLILPTVLWTTYLSLGTLSVIFRSLENFSLL